MTFTISMNLSALESFKLQVVRTISSHVPSKKKAAVFVKDVTDYMVLAMFLLIMLRNPMIWVLLAINVWSKFVAETAQA